ncbi:MAG: SUMF1/EgtB/PvdO family nonheme iron enzyme [Aggregatilineales bacterium]
MFTFNGQVSQHRIIPILEKLSEQFDLKDVFRDCTDDASLVQALHDWLKRTQFSVFTNQNIPIATRAEITREIGLLGLDTRAGVGLDENNLPDLMWCAVPAGDFLYGSDKKRDPYAYRTELPQKTLNVDYAYQVSVYPITTAQFQAFVQSDYSDMRWWADFPAEYQPHAVNTDENPSLLAKALNLPATLISWYQAVAFCRWLTVRYQGANIITADQMIRLPTDVEWEKAARGTDGRVYPYGDDAEADFANMSGTDLGDVCPVGLFADGVSPYGTHDMSGNVFEWCTANTEDISAGQILRGGSYYMSEEWARCAYRYERMPAQQLKDSGFRVVLSDIRNHPIAP